MSRITSESIAKIAAETLVVGYHSELPLSGPAAEVDAATGGVLSKLIERKEITGKRGETVSILSPSGIAANQILVVGLGARETFDRGAAFRSCAVAAKALSGKVRGTVAFYLASDWPGDWVESGVAGSMVGCVGQDLYRAKKNRNPLTDTVWAVMSETALLRGTMLGEAVNLTRRLVNEPPSAMYPESFAAEATKVAKDCGVEIDVWDEKKLQDERCGSMLAVAQGSTRPARLVILKYQGGPVGAPPLAIVGKGVTFDSGGLSIKPSDGMKTMKCDMAGAATVLGAIQAIARLKLPVNVVGFCGLVENMVSGNSYKLGDVLTARSGKTIEVLNTDAEGRLVLADVLNIALEYQPSKIIDLATLTGACLVALGTDVAGLMTNNQSLCDELKSAAETCGEPVWQLPMFPEFGEQIRSEVADIKNIGEGRWGGAITAAKFLEEFVNEKPWVHVDIAGPAFLEGSKPWMDGGGTGYMVRTLVELVRRHAAA